MSYKKITLKNGLRLILVPQPSSLATTVLVLVEAGSEYETKNINGISHFLEHMCFKGTVKRPKPGMISQELDALGAEYNAFTTQEFTGYWAKVRKEKVNQVFEIVADLYLNPLFNPEEIDKERGVIIQEINMYEDTPMRRVQELFTSLLYGDQPAGWDVAGRKEIIRRLKREDFVEYRKKHYVAPATVVVVAGAFKEKEIKEETLAMFGGLKRGPKYSKLRVKESQKSPQILLKFKESDQSHIVLGARAFNIFDKRKYALEVMSHVLGGGMSSRLFHRVREELGAAYYVKSGVDLFVDHGYLSVSAGVDHGKIEVVIRAILDELRRLKEETVGEKELKKAKDHMIGALTMSLETSDELAVFYGGEEIMTRSIVSPRDLISKINKVKAEEIKSLACSILKDSKLNLAIIGPYRSSSENKFKRILTIG